MRDYPDGLPGYDLWKLATPPEYEWLGDEPCSACKDTRQCPECNGLKMTPLMGGPVTIDFRIVTFGDCPCCDGTGQCPECSKEVDAP